MSTATKESPVTKLATVRTNLTKDTRITSIDEALEASNLNFIAEEHKLETPSGIIMPEHKAIIRPDTETVLGVVGKKYVPTQNSLSFAFMDAIVKKHGFHYSEAVSKDGGAVTMITAQSDKNDVVAVGDEVCRQIKLINGFNGKVGLSVSFEVLRLVCTNGMVKSERESVMRFKHTIRVQDRMETALRVFDESVDFHENFLAEAKRLSQVAVDKNMVETFLSSLFSDSSKNDKKKEHIEYLFQNGKGNKGETAWDLLNGTTEWVDHYAGKDDKRNDYSIFGAGHKLKEKAFDLVMAYA